jgi:hypothetical protein
MAVLAVLIFASAPRLTAQARYDRYDRGQDVSPTFDGWERNPDGTYNFYFGYLNRNAAESLDIPIGSANTVAGGGDRGQPTHFYPGRRWWVFKIIAPKDWPKEQRLVWTLTSRGRTNQAKAWLQPEWEIDAGIMLRNARDSFLFSGGNETSESESQNRPPSVTGSPAQVITAPQTATIRIAATDDGLPKADPGQKGRGRQQAGIRVRWTLYRGAGVVRFDPETSGPAPVSPATSQTNVSFAAPGDYRLRAIVSDGLAFSTYDVDVHVNPAPSASAGR